MYLPLLIAGGAYKHKSPTLSAQVARNFMPQVQIATAEAQLTLEPFPGLKAFSSGTGMDRGMLDHGGVLYKVTGTTFSSVNSSGTRTTLGTIPGAARCVLVGSGTSVLIVTSGSVYQWNGTTLTAASDPDFETPNSVAVLNTQAIYDGDNGRFGVADPGDPLAINGLNYANAESDADELLRVFVFGQTLYLFGDKSIEPWWNSGVGNPPFDRIEGGIIPVGLAAIHSIAATDRVMYFFGDDRNVYRIASGGFENNFTPQPLLRTFKQLSIVSDAIGMIIPYEGINLYILKFPNANKSYCYIEGIDWIELSSSAYDTLGNPGRYRGNSYAYAYGKHLIADEDGNILELDDQTYTEIGDIIKRVRIMSPLHGGLFGQPGKEVELSSIRVTMETGQNNAIIMLSISEDGGRTFGTEMWGTTGELGEYLTQIEWHGINARGMSLVIKFATSDPHYYSFHSAAAEVRLCI